MTLESDATAQPPRLCRPPWLATRLSLQMFLAFAIQGAWVPIFVVYLQQIGISDMAAAWAFTPYSLSSLIAPMAWGQVADRWVAAERCICLCAVVVAAALATMPYLHDALALWAAGVVFWFFMIPVNSLGTALTMRQLARPERSFGRVRLWGTVGWAGASMALTVWLHAWKPLLLPHAEQTLADCFWLGAGFAMVLAIYSLTLPNTPPSQPLPMTARPARGLRRLRGMVDAPLLALSLMRERRFLTYCICLFGFYLTYPFSAQMMPLLLEQLGIERAMLPLTLTIAQSTEIATLAVLPWLLSRLGFRSTMLLGIGAWTLGFAAFVVGQPAALVLCALTTQGLFIGCFLVAGQVFVNRQSRPDVRASAQGLVILIAGAGLLAGHLIAGWVREITQGNFSLAFLPPAGACVVLVVVFLTGFTGKTVAVPEGDSLVSSQEMT